MTYLGRLILVVLVASLTLNITELVAGDADFWDGIFATAQALAILWWFVDGEQVWKPK